MSKLLCLDRGRYLGKVVDICYADGIIAGVQEVILMYKKYLELNPQNEGGRKALEELQKK